LPLVVIVCAHFSEIRHWHPLENGQPQLSCAILHAARLVGLSATGRRTSWTESFLPIFEMTRSEVSPNHKPFKNEVKPDGTEALA
jgi:hypothetical protein